MAKYLISSDKTLKAVKLGDERKRINAGLGLYLQLFVKGGSHGWLSAYWTGLVAAWVDAWLNPHRVRAMLRWRPRGPRSSCRVLAPRRSHPHPQE